MAWVQHIFLSTLSARRATRYWVQESMPIWISIHALREEGDPTVTALLHWSTDFYPRPPRGGRLVSPVFVYNNRWISIHALREEGDFRACTGKTSA